MFATAIIAPPRPNADAHRTPVGPHRITYLHPPTHFYRDTPFHRKANKQTVETRCTLYLPTIQTFVPHGCPPRMLARTLPSDLRLATMR